jgi:hypothetical protein
LPTVNWLHHKIEKKKPLASSKPEGKNLSSKQEGKNLRSQTKFLLLFWQNFALKINNKLKFFLKKHTHTGSKQEREKKPTNIF